MMSRIPLIITIIISIKTVIIPDSTYARRIYSIMCFRLFSLFSDKPMLFSCSLYESFLANLVFNMILMINIVVALGYPKFSK